MELNNKFNSNELVNFNATNGAEKWKWVNGGNAIEAVNNDGYNNVDMYILMGAEILALVEIAIFIGIITEIIPHMPIVFNLFLFVIAFLGIPAFIIRSIISKKQQIRNFLTHKLYSNTILDTVELNKAVSNNSLNNIVSSLNNFKNKDDKDNYDKILWNIKNLTPSEINNNYSGNVSQAKNKVPQ